MAVYYKQEFHQTAVVNSIVIANILVLLIVF